MTAPVRAPSPSRSPARAARAASATAPATLRRAGAAASARPAVADGEATTPQREVFAPGEGPTPSPGGVGPQRRRAGDAPVRPELRLVDSQRLEVASRQRRARLLLVLAGLLVIGSLFGVVICHAMLVTGQGRLDDLEQQVSQEQTRYQALRLEVAELESPGRIVEAAHALGMVSPAEITYLTPVAPSAAGAGAGSEVGAATAGAAPWATVKPLLGGRG